MRPLVLLHGWGLGPHVWSGLIEALGPGFDIHAPALPGHGEALSDRDRGKSPANDTQPNLPEGPLVANVRPDGPDPGGFRPPAASLDAWADVLAPALPDGAIVCGWSLGAMLALELAHSHPAKAARLVLIGATPRFVSHAEGMSADSSDGKRETQASEPSTWPHGLEVETVSRFVDGFAADPRTIRRRFVALQALNDARRREVAAALDAALVPLDAGRQSALTAGLEILAASDLRPIVASIRQPALLLHGAGDALMPVGAARWLAATLPKARLTVFDDCGHAPFLSRPQACAAWIDGFAHD